MGDYYYIKPILGFYSSFEDAFSDQAEHIMHLWADEEKWEFDDFLLTPLTFVLAEPGYGKTVLLEQIIPNLESQDVQGIFIDCKKINEATIEGYINQLSKNPKSVKTNSFEFRNEKDVLVCLDALDEVKTKEFSNVVEKIKYFISSNDRVRVIVSCRRHYFRNHVEVFSEFDVRFARIYAFSREQVFSYLKHNSIPHGSIVKINHIIYSRGRDIVIQTPRYLKLLTDYLQLNKGVDIEGITKAGLFEYFIYKKLEIEDKKLNTEKRDIVKRVLEKLALIMEIYQTNELKKDELMTFFDDVKSDLKKTLLDQIELEIFYEKTVLKDNPDSIEFDNTEFQEYLAAKELTRIGKNSRIIFELAVDSEIREIIPSWFNTLGFLVDMEISILKLLLNFGQSSGEVKLTQDEEYHRLLTKVQVGRLTANDRRDIFIQVFAYYQDVLHWIDYNVAENLSYYYDPSLYGLLKHYPDKRHSVGKNTKRSIFQSNVAEIVGLLIERNSLNIKERRYWKNKLIDFVNDPEKNAVMQRTALYALAKLKDDSIIERVESIWESEDETVKNAFLNLCTEVNANHSISLQYFVKATKLSLIHARYGLWKVTERSTIEQLLDNMITDSVFLNKFLDLESIYKKEDVKIIDNIDEVWDDNIGQKLHEMLIRTNEYQRHLAEQSAFIKQSALLLRKYDQDYIFKLISHVESIEKSSIWGDYHFFEFIFALILEKEQVKDFISRLAKVLEKRILYWTFHSIKISEKPEAEEIFEEGRKYLPKEYKEAEKRSNEQKNSASEDVELYTRFRLMLEPEKGKYIREVFAFYRQNKEKLYQLITAEDKNRLKNLTEGTIFKYTDPAKEDLTITDIDDKTGRVSYRLNSMVHIFGDCLLIAKDVNVETERFRRKIISYIPFAYSEHLEEIFSFIHDIKSDEIQLILDTYKKKKSDKWLFMPRSFIKACKKYRIIAAVPILRSFVEEPKFSGFDRGEAFKAVEAIQPDPVYLNSVFKKYIDNKEPGKRHLAFIANRFLIEDHNNKDAILWRMDEIIRRSFPFKRIRGVVHEVSDEERELKDMIFAAPIMELKRPEFEGNFLDLLKKSFEIYREDNREDYAEYLWRIVCAYFENRKEERSYGPLKTLATFVNEHSSVEGINWFKYRLKELKRAYLNYIGKPQSINECIKTYNQLKSEQYLEIARPYDLKEIIIQLLSADLRRWLQSEGSFIKNKSESEIQKFLRMKIEIFLLRKGFKDVDIIREPQLLDGKRTDFLVFYGFLGPILIELKLSTNEDIGPRKKLENQTSYINLKQYMQGFRAQYGVFFVIDNKKRTKRSVSWENQLKAISKSYQKIENVEVVGVSF